MKFVRVHIYKAVVEKVVDGDTLLVRIDNDPPLLGHR